MTFTSSPRSSSSSHTDLNAMSNAQTSASPSNAQHSQVGGSTLHGHNATSPETTEGSAHNAETAKQIQRILQRRAERLPKVQAQKNHWQQIHAALEKLPQGLMTAQPAFGDRQSDVDRLLAQNADLQSKVYATLQALDVASRRFARNTVNIGVGGRTRMGKSTLLQSISGLGETQIPTGGYIPTTATSSLLFHQADNPHADITFHTFESFRDKTLVTYHTRLGLPDAPMTVEAFRNYSYPRDAEAFAKNCHGVFTAEAMINHLKIMQKCLPSYEHLLTGQTQNISLEDLRPYVSYPSQDEEKAGKEDRKYLAVKRCEIYTSFRHGGIEHLGIVDIPGLGEVDPEAEKRTVDSLQNDADIVLFLKRNAESDLSVGTSDTNAMNVIDRARKPIKNPEDYVFVVLNMSENDPERIDTLRTKVRAGWTRHTIYECNVADPEEVNAQVLQPVLQHLVERLPSMDDDIWNAAITEASALESSLREFARTFQSLSESMRHQHDPRKRLDALTAKILTQFAGQLNTLIEETYQQKSDEKFCEAVDMIDKGLQNYLGKGFHLGDKKKWLTEATATILQNAGWGAIHDETRNYLRIHVSDAYKELDAFFSGNVLELRRALGKLLQNAFQDAVAPEGNETPLDAFLRQCGHDFPTLREAIETINRLEITYNAHLYPWVRDNLGDLEPRSYDKSGSNGSAGSSAKKERSPLELFKSFSKQFAPQAGAETQAEDLYHHFETMGKTASSDISRVLKEKEARTGVRVLAAAIAQFDDRFIRSLHAQEELRDFVERHADLIAPDEFGKERENQRLIEDILAPLSKELVRVVG